MTLLKLGRGRPKKYGRDSRAVTIRLPEDVLDSLETLDADVGRAIVRLVERQGTMRAPVARPAEISAYGNHAVIVVKPARALTRLPGVQLVPVGNGRSLIALERPLSIPQLELAVRDAIEGAKVSVPERRALQAIADILRRARLSRTVSLEERTIIVLESKRRPRGEPQGSNRGVDEVDAAGAVVVAATLPAGATPIGDQPRASRPAARATAASAASRKRSLNAPQS